MSGEWWQTKFSVSPGPALWSLVLGPFGTDLGPELDLTWDLDLDLSLTIRIRISSGEGKMMVYSQVFSELDIGWRETCFFLLLQLREFFLQRSGAVDRY